MTEEQRIRAFIEDFTQLLELVVKTVKTDEDELVNKLISLAESGDKTSTNSIFACMADAVELMGQVFDQLSNQLGEQEKNQEQLDEIAIDEAQKIRNAKRKKLQATLKEFLS